MLPEMVVRRRARIRVVRATADDDGRWMRGRVTVTGSALIFRAHRATRATEGLEIPFAEIVGDPESYARFPFRTLVIRTAASTVSLRCLGSNAFAARFSELSGLVVYFIGS